MRRILAAFPILFLFDAPLAAETVTATGTIESVDAAAGTVTIRRKTTNGEKTAQFKIARGTKIVFNGDMASLGRFEVGQKIEISYDNKAKQVTKLEAWPLPAAADNVPPEQFMAIFNGKDLSGWKGIPKAPFDNPAKRREASRQQLANVQREADDEMRKHWSVEDAVLIFDGEGSSLATAKDYGDFELWIDWKIEPGGDSGIYLRGIPQVQIWDPSSEAAKGVGSGGLYNNKNHASKPSIVADKPVGQWNTFKITIIGDHVSVRLNDVLVVDKVVLENFWEPNKPAYATGPIELQKHGSRLYFKNIYLRELGDDAGDAEASGGGSNARSAGNARPLLRGNTLDGWRGFDPDGTNSTPKWTADGGVLANYAQGPSLATIEEFGDFDLHLEFSLPPECNSGVYLRGRYEIQLIDSAARPGGRPLKPLQRCGAIYGQTAPSRDVYKGANQWNSLDVRTDGTTVTVRMNDVTIINRAKLKGATQGAPVKGDASRGPIILQSHGVTGAKFRNITITPR